LLIWYRALFKDLSAGRRVRLGRGVQIKVVKGGRMHLADDVVVEAHATLVAHGELIIGARAFVGQGAIIVSCGRISIGPDALIAEYVTIRDQDHGTSRTDVPYNLQQLRTLPVEIGGNVWLGSKVTVVAGVRIADGCVVGANSVVTRDLPAGNVCVGAPARPVKKVAAAGSDERGS
jgi:acetyltransferase-like isoleucine patch superfamily enzyme